jgi:hypothetical protein
LSHVICIYVPTLNKIYLLTIQLKSEMKASSSVTLTSTG